MFHATATVRSYDAALEWLAAFCGCRALEFNVLMDPLIGRKGGMTWIGDASLELMEPVVPGAGPDRFLRRYGPGMYCIALQVADLDGAAAWLTAHGVRIVGDLSENRWCFTRPQDTANILIEWSELESQNDPHFGAPIPAYRRPPLIDVRRVAHVGALVADPAGATHRLQELWPATVLFRTASPLPTQPAIGLSLGDNALVLYQMPPELEFPALWGPIVAKPRIHLLALRVRDLAATVRVLERERVRILRGDPAHGEVVTHPEDTHGLVLAWTDRDLPNDPRGPLTA